MEPPFIDALRRAFEAAGGRPLAQAATVSPGGLPEVRTVVLRGLGPGADAWFASDARSAKLASLAATPWLELCLFDARAGVQWRLLGRAALHTSDALARRTWQALPHATREQFFSPPPGGPLRGEAVGAPPPGRVSEARPPASFTVVRVPPERCDRLALEPRLARRRWSLGREGWTGEDLVP